MAQLIPTVPGIGAALGTGISSSLNALAEAKIKQMIEAPQQEKIAQILSYLSGAPEGNASQQEPSYYPEGASQQAQKNPQQVQPGIQKNPLIESLQRGGVGQQELAQLLGLAPQQEAAQQESQGAVAQKAQLGQPRQLTREKFKELLSSVPAHMQPQLIAAYQGQQAKIAEREKEERKTQQLDQREINKRTQPFYDKVIEGDKSAKQIKHRLKKLQRLDESGKLPPAALYNALTSLESIGTKEGAAIGGAIGGALGTGTGALLAGPLGATLGLTEGTAQGAALGAGLGAAIKPVTSILRSALIGAYPDTEEFEKTSLEFIKDVRPLIGGHVTENQLDLFLRSIPTLATTTEGRKVIIKNMGILAEGSTAEFDALEEIIEANNGKRPDGLEFKVARLADEKRKKYAEQWKI